MREDDGKKREGRKEGCGGEKLEEEEHWLEGGTIKYRASNRQYLGGGSPEMDGARGKECHVRRRVKGQCLGIVPGMESSRQR